MFFRRGVARRFLCWRRIFEDQFGSEIPAVVFYHFLKMVDLLAIRKLRNMLGSMSRLPAWSSLSKDANDSEGMSAQLKVTI